MCVSICTNGMSSKLPDSPRHLPALASQSNSNPRRGIKEGQEMMSGGRLCAFKSALKDGDRKGNAFLARWSQAGIFISKGE